MKRKMIFFLTWIVALGPAIEDLALAQTAPQTPNMCPCPSPGNENAQQPQQSSQQQQDQQQAPGSVKVPSLPNIENPNPAPAVNTAPGGGTTAVISPGGGAQGGGNVTPVISGGGGTTLVNPGAGGGQQAVETLNALPQTREQAERDFNDATNTIINLTNSLNAAQSNGKMYLGYLSLEGAGLLLAACSIYGNSFWIRRNRALLKNFQTSPQLVSRLRLRAAQGETLLSYLTVIGIVGVSILSATMVVYQHGIQYMMTKKQINTLQVLLDENRGRLDRDKKLLGYQPIR